MSAASAGLASEIGAASAIEGTDAIASFFEDEPRSVVFEPRRKGD